MRDKLKRFTDLLKEMFEIDKADLDFGIYRIMKLRKKEIENFIDNDLPLKVKGILSSYAKDNLEIKNKIKKIEDSCNELGVSIEELPDTSEKKKEYIELKKSLENGTSLAELETDVYSKLYDFFSRYYDEGDFISKRRYKEGIYAIPYEGEEVKLYWANHDQYYIKTSEYFKNYSFVSQGIKVNFKVVEATTEQDNNKEAKDEKRRFVLVDENFLETGDNEVNIYFEYKVHTAKQDTLVKSAYEKIESEISKLDSKYINALLIPAPTEKEKNRTLLKKHLTTYVAKNTFDYFIHKNLKKFLKRELDFYIKSEVMKLDDIGTEKEERVESYLCKIRAIKSIGEIIIDFLAQIEDFQKKLWLKKKFVVETNWCVTLDLIDEKFYPEIAANQKQIDEWIEYYKIDEIKAEDEQVEITKIDFVPFSNPLTVEFLKQNKNLVLDTKHFDNDFKERLIESIDNLDEKTNGLLVHSENFQALNLLKEKYKYRIKCCFIDPPYNTEKDRNEGKFIYKDGYDFSTWITMMENRIAILRDLLSINGGIFTTIDDTEYSELLELYKMILGRKNHIATIIWQKVHTRKNSAKYFSVSHDYIPCFAKNKEYWERVLIPRDNTDSYKNPDNDPKGPWKADPIYANNPYDADYTIVKPNGISLKKPVGQYWRFSEETIKNKIEKNEIIWGKGNSYPMIKRYLSEVQDGLVPTTIYDRKFAGDNSLANSEFDSMFGNDRLFSYPKPSMLIKRLLQINLKRNGYEFVIDFFAGSGTTGHAVINLNREYKSNHKYILVEMGNYFDVVTLPRIKKVIYSKDWKDGLPTNRDTGISQIVKYIRLESYEDTLNNINFIRNDKQQSVFDNNKNLYNEYLIYYMFDMESKDSVLNFDKFENPFDYKMKIMKNNVMTNQTIDLVETFNYLIGLDVVSQSRLLRFNACPIPYNEKDNDIYEGAVLLESVEEGKYCFKTVEGILPNGQYALIIWRNMTGDVLKDNAALDAFFNHYKKDKNKKYDVYYVNGDNNLENYRNNSENWKVNLIETVFKNKMFDYKEI